MDKKAQLLLAVLLGALLLVLRGENAVSQGVQGDEKQSTQGATELNALLTGQLLPAEVPESYANAAPAQNFPVLVSSVDVASGPITFESNRNGVYDIFTQDAGGATSAQPVVTGAWNDFTPAWSPDGKQVAFASDREGNFDIFLLDESGQITNLTQNAAEDAHPYWSPAGDRIIFTSNRGNGYFQIYTMRPNGSDVRQVTVIPGYHAMYPRYSPDGSRIAFMRASTTAPVCEWNWDVWVIDTQGGNQQRVTTQLLADLYPNWTPDGRIIYASCRNWLDFDLYTVDINTGAESRITDWFLSNEWGAVYGLDPNYIAFNSDVDGNTEIYIGSFNDGTASNLTQNSAEDLAASWRTAVTIPPQRYSVSGYVIDNQSNPIEGVMVTAGAYSDFTDTSGYWEITNLPEGFYSFVPGKHNYYFSPASQARYLDSDIISIDFRADRQVVILVHGWQGSPFSSNPMKCDPAEPENAANEIVHFNYEQIPPDTKTGKGYAVDYWEDLPSWLKDNYDTWIAQYTTNFEDTPSLSDNGQCLRNQIKHVFENTGEHPIILVAHSMGGLVSRARLSLYDCNDKVSKLLTLGSPHAGLPAAVIGFLLPSGCQKQPGLCQMNIDAMYWFNLSNPNRSNIDYMFLGGDNPDLLGHLWQIVAGENDGLVGKYSAVGWQWPLPLHNPIWWDARSPALNVWTDEVHSRAISEPLLNIQIYNDYYQYRVRDPGSGSRSYSYYCMIAWLEGFSTLPSFCQANSLLSQSEYSQPPYILNQKTSPTSGHLSVNESVNSIIQLDGEGNSWITLSWLTGTLTMTLTRPDGQLIDPIYATANPHEVAYYYRSGSAELLPSIT